MNPFSIQFLVSMLAVSAGVAATGVPGTYTAHIYGNNPLGYSNLWPQYLAGDIYTDNPTNVANQTKAYFAGKPAGKRALSLNYLCNYFTQSADATNYLWWDKAPLVRAKLLACFQRCAALGVELNEIVVDYEGVGPLSFNLIDFANRTNSWPKIQAIMADARFNTEIKPRLDALGYVPQPGQPYLYPVNFGDYANGRQTAIFDTVMGQRVLEYLNLVFTEPARSYYPDIKLSNYESSRYNTRFGASGRNGERPYETSITATNPASRVLGTHSQPETYGETGGNMANYFWLWPQDAISYERTPFHSALLSLNKNKAAILAPPATRLRPCIGGRDKTDYDAVLGKTDYYNELVLHLGLLAPQMDGVFAYFKPWDVGGDTATVDTNVTVAGVANAAPETVYRKQVKSVGGNPADDIYRSITGLTPNSTQTLRLHFAEGNPWIDYGGSGVNQRVFNVRANGALVLTNFDIYAAAPGKFKACVRDVPVTVDAYGQVTLELTTTLGQCPLIAGAEVLGVDNRRVDFGHDDHEAPPGWEGDEGTGIRSRNDTGLTKLLAQLDEVGGYADRATLVRDLQSWEDDYLLTGMIANGQHLWRISPDLTRGVTVASFKVSNSPPTFEISGRRITFPAGSSIYTPADPAAAPGGYWVTSPLGTYPDASFINPIRINCGGAATGTFAADSRFHDSAGNTSGSATSANNINTSSATNPAPAAVYQSWRFPWDSAAGTFYTFAMLNAGQNYKVRLHFAEAQYSSAGKRSLTLTLSGFPVLTNFDIFAAAGGQNRAVVREFDVPADRRGQIVLHLQGNNASLNGIEILPSTSPLESFWDGKILKAPIPGGEGLVIRTNAVPTHFGTGFTPLVAGRLTHLKAFSVTNESGPHIARVWNKSENALLYEKTNWNYGGAEGWVTLDIPDLNVQAGKEYIVSVSTGTDVARACPSYTGFISALGGRNGRHLAWPSNAAVAATSALALPTAFDEFGSSQLRDVIFEPGNFLTPLEAWRQQHFGTLLNLGDAADTADPDQDGMVNLLEHVFGLDPTLPGVAGAPSGGLAGNFLTLTYTRNKAATNLTCLAEVTSSLTGGWSSAATNVNQLWQVIDHPDFQTITARDQTAATNAPKRFMRLKVSQP